jgi:HEXXH motif-containing protein
VTAEIAAFQSVAEVRNLLASQLPFLDECREPNRLVAAGVATRYWRAGSNPPRPASDVKYWTDPVVACDLIAGPPSHLSQVTGAQRTMISDAIRSATAVKPQWRDHFELPIRFLLLPADSKAISASAPHWPQHIMLSRAAFESADELREQVVHEFCHQWMYLLEEVCPLERESSSRDLVLPSGTSERSPREVLGAAHVGLALIDMYSTNRGTHDHLDTLRTYVRGCLDVADSIEDLLTDEGVQLSRRMRRRLHS